MRANFTTARIGRATVVPVAIAVLVAVSALALPVAHADPLSWTVQNNTSAPISLDMNAKTSAGTSMIQFSKQSPLQPGAQGTAVQAIGPGSVQTFFVSGSFCYNSAWWRMDPRDYSDDSSFYDHFELVPDPFGSTALAANATSPRGHRLPIRLKTDTPVQAC